MLLDDGHHSYLYGPSSTPIAQVNGATGEMQYLHSDLLGTPRLVTDDAGAVVGTSTFDAFGTLGAHSGVQSAVGFTGNLFDEATGLLYLRARDYDSTTGQFLTIDPLVDQTRQPYAYAGNNPITRTDPTGLAAADVQAFFLGALDGLTGGVSSMILEATVPGYDSFIKAHNTAFTSGSVIAQVAVAVVVIVTTAGAGAVLVAARYAATAGARAGIKAGLREVAQQVRQVGSQFAARMSDDAGSLRFGPGGGNYDALAINVGKQDKHVPTANNFIPGRSELTTNADRLLDRVGSGTPLNNVKPGTAGYKERVDFNEVIGRYTNGDGNFEDTTVGIVHYGSNWLVHIVPARPRA